MKEPTNIATIGTRGSGKTVSDLKLAYNSILKSDQKYMFLDFHNEGEYNLKVLDGKLLHTKTISVNELDSQLDKPDAPLTILKMHGDEYLSKSKEEKESMLMNINKRFDGTLIYEGIMVFPFMKLDKMFACAFKKASHIVQFTSLSDFLTYRCIYYFNGIKLHKLLCAVQRYQNIIPKEFLNILSVANLIANHNYHSIDNRYFYCMIDFVNMKITGDFSEKDVNELVHFLSLDINPEIYLS